MTLYRFPENKWTKALIGLLLFAMLYLCRDTLVTSSLLGFYKSQFLMLGLLAMAAAAFLWVNRKQWKAVLTDARVAFMGICAVVLLLPMVLKRDFTMMYFSVLVCVLAAVFFTYFLTLEEAAKAYVVILAALGAYSVLAAYGLRRLPDAGAVSIPVFQNSHGVEFYNFILSFVPLEYVKTRNFGIFREPGVYQFFLMLGLYLNHYVVSWEKPSRMWIVSGILAAVMLTTFATGGVAELALFGIILFFDKKLYRNKWTWCVLAAVALGIAGILIAASTRQTAMLRRIYWELYDMVIGKFTYQEESIGDRVGSVAVNMGAFLGNPLCGQKISEVLYAITNNTTSTLIQFACFGVAGGILHVAGWVALVWKKERKLWVNLGLLAVVFLSFNTQNLIADLFFWLFPVMALTEYLVPRLKNHKRRK